MGFPKVVRHFGRRYYLLRSRGRWKRRPRWDVWLLGDSSSGSGRQTSRDNEVLEGGMSRPLRRSAQADSATFGRCGRPFGGQLEVTLVPRRSQSAGNTDRQRDARKRGSE